MLSTISLVNFGDKEISERIVQMFSKNSKLQVRLHIVCIFALLICTWFLKNRVKKIKLDELDFFVYIFRSWILQATQAVNIKFKLGKKSSSSNLIFQTRFFRQLGELENKGSLTYVQSENFTGWNEILGQNW